MTTGFPVRTGNRGVRRPGGSLTCRTAVVAVLGLLAIPLMFLDHPAAQQVPPQRVSGAQISALIRNTVIAINQANLTGNYTVLRDLGSLSFHNSNSASSLADIFRPIRKENIDLSDTVLLDPRLSEAPKLTTDGVLKLKGWFQTKPRNLTFDLTYRFENRLWRVMSISLGFKPHVDKAS